jgi:hypothetical protein
VAIRQCLTLKTQVPFMASLCGIYGEQIGTGADFSTSTIQIN